MKQGRYKVLCFFRPAQFCGSEVERRRPCLSENWLFFDLTNFKLFRICGGDGEVLKLLLPRSVKNARMRLNDTNACVVEPTRGLAIAGVRRDIFVWSLEKQELLRNVT